MAAPAAELPLLGATAGGGDEAWGFGALVQADKAIAAPAAAASRMMAL
jgi:hypothetical protein